MSQALRKLSGAIKTSNTAMVFTNQLRHKIGVMFGSPETTPGGRALKYYASVRIDLRRIGSTYCFTLELAEALVEEPDDDVEDDYPEAEEDED